MSIYRKGKKILGNYPKASNYIDDTQPRADRMFSSEKITTDFAKKSELEPVDVGQYITPSSDVISMYEKNCYRVGKVVHVALRFGTTINIDAYTSPIIVFDKQIKQSKVINLFVYNFQNDKTYAMYLYPLNDDMALISRSILPATTDQSYILNFSYVID